jgi:hypothetical protein
VLGALVGPLHTFQADIDRPVRAFPLRSRRIRGQMMLSTPCRKDIGRGSHEIDAIISRPMRIAARRPRHQK